MGNRFAIPVVALLLLVAFSAPAAADTVSLESDTDRMGGDYKGFALRTADPQLCRIACERDEACKAYTFVRPGLKGPQAMCFLKSELVPSSPSDCCTSGARTAARGGRPPPIALPAPPPEPPPAPAPAPKQSITPPHTVIAKSDLNQVEILWTWHSQGCFPSAAGQPPQPCNFVKDIEGFRIYASNGALRKDLAQPNLRSALAAFEPGMCYTVTAYKGALESAKSHPGCVDAPAVVSQTSSNVAVPLNLHQVSSIPDCIAVTHDTHDFCKSLFAKNSRLLTWYYAPTNISGFRLYYEVNGSLALLQSAEDPQRRYFVIPANTGVLQSTACLRVRAFQPWHESASSNSVCLQPVAVPVVPVIKLTPVSGIVLTGSEARANFNDACPLDEVHRHGRSTEPFTGGFPVGWARENNDDFDENFLSSGILCDAWSTEWHEGSVKFSLADLPTKIRSATLGFKSTSGCATAMHAYFDTLADNSSDPSHGGDPKAWFSWLENEAITGEVKNAPGESSTSAIDVTALVKKSLAAGRKKLGFVVYTDTALKDDESTCVSAYSDFTLTIKPLQP